jgi:hypothetical protein
MFRMNQHSHTPSYYASISLVISDNGAKSENMHISNYMCEYSQQEIST